MQMEAINYEQQRLRLLAIMTVVMVGLSCDDMANGSPDSAELYLMHPAVIQPTDQLQIHPTGACDAVCCCCCCYPLPVLLASCPSYRQYL
jgi:hypothetical protein